MRAGDSRGMPAEGNRGHRALVLVFWVRRRWLEEQEVGENRRRIGGRGWKGGRDWGGGRLEVGRCSEVVVVVVGLRVRVRVR